MMQAGGAMGNLASAIAIPSDEAALVEELKAGSERAFTQLIAQYHQPIYSVIARQAMVAGRRRTPGPRRPAIVRRVRVCEPADGVAEAAVVVSDGPRVRAVAVRLVGQDGKWRVSALQVG